MRIIFLGCGYLGSNLSRILSEQYDVEIWGIESPYSKKESKFRLVDVLNPEVFSGQDFSDAVVIDTMGIVANNQRVDDEDEALADLRRRYGAMLEVLKTKPVRLFVFLSSGGTVYGNQSEAVKETDDLNPENLYARSKVMEEKMIRESGIPYLIIRLSNPYGGYQVVEKRQGVIPILIRRVFKEEPFEQWVSSETMRDYIYIDDFAAAISLLLRNGVVNEIVNVGSGIGTSLGTLIAESEKAVGKTLNIISEAGETVIGNNRLDISKLKQLTGFEPVVSIQEGIRRETERIREEENL